MAHDDTLKMIGKLAPEGAGRDAIHIAVAPVVAAAYIDAGNRIGWHERENNLVTRVPAGHPNEIGLADPFLRQTVCPGERFFAFLHPGSISSLRHVWTHAAFPDEVPMPPPLASKQASEEWLRAFVASADCPSYERVIAAAIGGDMYGEGDRIAPEYDALFFYGADAHGEIPPEFWTHVEVVTGRMVPPEHRVHFFSCSC